MSTDSRESYLAANERTIQELKESEARYRSLIEQARDGVVLLQDGLVSYANQSLCKLVGYSRDELVGSAFEKYIPEDLKAKITDNYKKRMNSEPAPTIYEAAILHKSGARLETEFNAGLTQWNGRLADLVYLRDIRERKLAEKERDQIFNLSHDLVGIAGFDGYFKQMNLAWEVVLGYTKVELMAKSFLDFIHPEDKEKTEKEVEKLASGQSTIDFENRYIHKDGSIRHISWSATPLPELSNLYCIGRDITERKKAEEQILNYQSKLKDQAAQLMHSEDKQHKQLAANLHDHVGQLLASSRLQLAALNKHISVEEILSKTRSISEGLVQAIQATREVIFDLSPPQLNEIGLYAAVADWLDEQIEAKYGVRTRIVGPDQIYPMDPHLRYLLFRSIRELLHNVVKHASATQVEVGLYLKGQILEVTVKDNGIGFTYIPEVLRHQSSGLGLFSILDRVESLGGDVEIQSSPGLGTAILLKVPLFKYLSYLQAHLGILILNIMAISVIFVDDHRLFLMGLQTVFKGTDVIDIVGEARDGLEALKLVEEKRPDVVVMDITMPNMNGIEATKKISAKFPETKVLALSIHSGKRFVKEMLDAGASGYLLKDSAPDELVKAIHAIEAGHMYLSSTITATALEKEQHQDQVEDQSILQTKLYRPPLLGDVISRKKAIVQLNQNIHNPITLISAPAGYGKSILASQWLEQTKLHYCWVSLDEELNDLRTFLSYTRTAIELLFPGALQKTGALLQGGLPPVKVIAHSLVNELDQILEDFILVLDDYHMISDEQVNALMDEILRFPPQPMHLLILTRRDPNLRLSRFRSNKRMLEIRMEDLSFSTEEISELYQKLHQISLPDHVLLALQEKTEGWIVSLRLVSYSIQNLVDLERIISNLEGGFYSISTFLLEEVLSIQPDEIQKLMLECSIFERFCAELVDAICLPEKDIRKDDLTGETFIESLNKSNLFAISLDHENRWFRFHHLFKDFLRKEMKERIDPDRIKQLNLLASDWFQDHQMIEEAIEFALKGRDPALAAEIMEKHRIKLLNADDWKLLEKRLSMLPEELVHNRLPLLLANAWVAKQRFRLVEMMAYLQRSLELMGDPPKRTLYYGEWCFLTGWMKTYLEGDPTASLSMLNQAMDLIPEKPMGMLRSELELQTGITGYMAKSDEVVQKFEKRLSEANMVRGVLWERLIFGKATISLLNGSLGESYHAAKPLNEYCQNIGNPFLEGWSAWFLGTIALHKFQLEKALKLFLRVAELQYNTYDRAAIDSFVGQALAYSWMGQADRAKESMKMAEEYAAWTGDPGQQDILLAAQARISLILGDHNTAFKWQSAFVTKAHVPSMVFFLANPFITECRVLLLQGTDSALNMAMQKLEEYQKGSDAINYINQCIEILVLLSLAYELSGRNEEAIHTLERVLSLAEPGAWVRPFMEAGPTMTALLKKALDRGLYVEYIGKILNAIDAFTSKESQNRETQAESRLTHHSPRTDRNEIRLTQREMEVLELLSDGLRNKEIASRIHVSEDTVKKHLYNMFQKLNTKNRMELIDIARSLGLVSA